MHSIPCSRSWLQSRVEPLPQLHLRTYVGNAYTAVIALSLRRRSTALALTTTPPTPIIPEPGARLMSDRQIIAVNRRARHDYEIMETYDAGLVLTGTEIKSVRDRRVDLRDSYAQIGNGEAWLHNLHIGPYAPGSRENRDPKRTRKLLLHRREIERLLGRTTEHGLTIIPLRLYLQRGYAKVELGLARGKRQWDKRKAIAEREARREEQRALSERRRSR
jgi:SsrA-binding protein